MKEATVDEIFYDGKVYGLRCIATSNNYGNPYYYKTYRIASWVDVRPIIGGDTNFSENQDVRLYNQKALFLWC